VAQQLLQNGLAEVLCNVVHCLHQMSSVKCVVDVINADIEHLFCAVARVAFWYFYVFCHCISSLFICLGLLQVNF